MRCRRLGREIRPGTTAGGMVSAAIGGGAGICPAAPDVAEGRLPEDQEEEQGDGGEQEIRAQPVLPKRRREEAQEEADQRHEEGGDRPDVHELVLEMVAREQFPQPAFQPIGGLRSRPGRAGRGRRGCRHSYPVGLSLAAEPTEPGIRFDGLAAFMAEDLIVFGRHPARQGRPIIRLRSPIHGDREQP